MKIKEVESIRDRIRMAIVQEINSVNIVAQQQPEEYLPRFIENLTQEMHELVIDELVYGRHRVR